jgi:hypothetical protein
MVKYGPQKFSQHPCGSFYYRMEAGSLAGWEIA